MTETNTGNRLAGETSPYLLQHAGNPVHWHAWGPDALDLARREGKPILLSIGYSACHWCHVMAHESFEDEETAQLMNELFVNVKVDREERPDLDKIYQTAHQLITQRSGGWPLTMFITHDAQIPFFGGTYFPKEARYGMPAFKDVLERVATFYRDNGAEVAQQAASISDVFARIDAVPTGNLAPDLAPLDAAVTALRTEFDLRNGGFGSAPKFPQATNLELLLRTWAGQPDEQEPLRQMAVFTLEKMALGGIYDQLGGGFCRYSVDATWTIPHFEKMLYDNAQLLSLCAQALSVTADPLFERVTRETAAWMIRDMQSPEGAYYATLDADSEGEEGRFYVWEPDEVRSLVGEDIYPAVARRFGLDGQPNFEGQWHLCVQERVDALAPALGLEVADARARIDDARATLLAAREQRVWPGRDDKILTGWNGLAIRGMAIAARELGDAALAASATRAVDFIERELWRARRLLATCKDGRAHLPAYLDDYAFLADGLLELLQTRWRTSDLLFAQALADCMLAHFEDPEHGGFYFTANDHEALIHRPRPLADEAVPSGNGVAARVLNRLGHLLGRPDYVTAAERTVRAAWGGVARYPHAHASLLMALQDQLEPPVTVILRGAPAALRRWQQRLSDFAPGRMTLAIPDDAENLPDALAQRRPRGAGVAYICRGSSCSPPVENPDALAEALARH